MPGLAFASAVPVPVAYVHVNEDGTSPDLNSGVVTSKPSQGVYLVNLPSNLGQAAGRPLAFVQITQGSTSNILSSLTLWISNTQLQIRIFAFGGGDSFLQDSPFDLLILRSTLSPPLNAPA